MSPITGNPSLFPQSHTPSSDRSPYGFPARAPRCAGGRWGLPRSLIYRRRGAAPTVCLGFIFSGAVLWQRAPMVHGSIRQRAFWLWPDSSFGQSILTRSQAMIQLPYPCRTHLAPRPPCCWQCPVRSLTATTRRIRGDALSVGLHTRSLPSMHADVGDCRLHGRSMRTHAKARAGLTR